MCLGVCRGPDIAAERAIRAAQVPVHSAASGQRCLNPSHRAGQPSQRGVDPHRPGTSHQVARAGFPFSQARKELILTALAPLTR